VKTEKTRRRENVGSGNWKGVGMWAWILHRVSGLVILGYLFVHIDVMAQGRGGPAGFDPIFETFESPLFIILDLVLVAGIMYHMWNGVRVLIFDFGTGTYSHKTLYYAMMGLAVLSLAIFAYFSIAFLLS
jgi:succinate dehydrogenase / fumarate reductase, cytochrome b subunit